MQGFNRYVRRRLAHLSHLFLFRLQPLLSEVSQLPFGGVSLQGGPVADGEASFFGPVFY